ncbi:transcriptional regulator [Acetobacter sp.]|uniref:transcriptional regulator n=1 Tax=Acetobacter sp. TaxID=440 RepID=UPI0039E776CE
MMNERVKKAVEAAGGATKLANALGIRAPSIYSWKDIPPRRVSAISRITGISKADLRPDMFSDYPSVQEKAA